MAKANPGGRNSGEIEFLSDPDAQTILRDKRPCIELPGIFFHHDPSDLKASIELTDIEQDRPRKLCSACPVLENCIAYAAREKIPGFWGCTTAERKGVSAAGHINQDKLRAAVMTTRVKGSSMPGVTALSDEQIIMEAKEVPYGSKYFVRAAARLCGLRSAVQSKVISPAGVFDIAHYVVGENMSPLSFVRQTDKGIRARVVTEWKGRIEENLESLDGRVKGRLLGRIPLHALVSLPTYDPLYTEGVRQALTLRAITERIDVEPPDMHSLIKDYQDVQQAEIRKWADTNGFTRRQANEYLLVVRARYATLPPAVQERITMPAPVQLRPMSVLHHSGHSGQRKRA